ncbi:hypothetical protein M758_11G021800 [Ceratodon purpureus]|nr:hypothetical protein M758_11G021800 [Ceratodon purpureus]
MQSPTLSAVLLSALTLSSQTLLQILRRLLACSRRPFRQSSSQLSLSALRPSCRIFVSPW